MAEASKECVFVPYDKPVCSRYFCFYLSETSDCNITHPVKFVDEVIQLVHVCRGRHNLLLQEVDGAAIKYQELK